MQKRLLVLGGQQKFCDIILRAREMGIYTIVTDWYEDSPAKRIADKAYMVSTSDVEGILQLIRDEQIDGVITGYIDSTLPYYYEICQSFAAPSAGGEFLIGVDLVLHVYLRYVNTLCVIRLQIFFKIESVCLLVVFVFNKSSVVVNRGEFHPCGRTPWRREKSNIGSSLLSFFYSGNDVFFIAIYRKVRHFIVALVLVIAIPYFSKIVCADGQTAEIEVAVFFAKQKIEYGVLLFFRKCFNSLGTKLAYATTKAVQRLSYSISDQKLFTFDGRELFRFIPGVIFC